MVRQEKTWNTARVCVNRNQAFSTSAALKVPLSWPWPKLLPMALVFSRLALTVVLRLLYVSPRLFCSDKALSLPSSPVSQVRAINPPPSAKLIPCLPPAAALRPNASEAGCERGGRLARRRVVKVPRVLWGPSFGGRQSSPRF